MLFYRTFLSSLPRFSVASLATTWPLLLCCLWFSVGYLIAPQVAADQQIPATTKKETPPKVSLKDQLTNILVDIQGEKNEYGQLKKELKNTRDEDKKKSIQSKMKESLALIKGWEKQFASLATDGISLAEPIIRSKSDEPYHWQDDLEAIVAPLLEQLKVITARPRMLEDLNSELEALKRYLSNLKRGEKALEQTLKELPKGAAQQYSNKLLAKTVEEKDTTEKKLALIRSNIKELNAEQNPMWETLTQSARNTGVTMALHLMAALVITLIVYQVILLIGKVPVYLLSKRKGKQFIFVERTIHLVTQSIATVLAALIYMVLLYSFSEWMLLIISLVIVATLIMGLRQAIPQYLVELRTLLNLGSVRQGERLVLNGIPWRIAKLDVYSHLHNPWLDGHIRMPITQLVNLCSRPFHHDEPWFPCRVGEMVLLNGEILGKVNSVSPEQVILERGRTLSFYTAEEFVQQAPQNLSRSGFSIFMVLGLDYELQPNALNDVLPKLKLGLTAAINHSDFQKHLQDLVVEFDAAAASSLDYRVIAHFDSDCASDYFRIQRCIQAAFVRIANEQGWSIPFQQLQVHVQDIPFSSENSAKAPLPTTDKPVTNKPSSPETQPVFKDQMP